jgi:hypothetical protein
MFSDDNLNASAAAPAHDSEKTPAASEAQSVHEAKVEATSAPVPQADGDPRPERARRLPQLARPAHLAAR